MFAEKEFSRSKVHHLTNEPARLPSSFASVARKSLPSAPTSLLIPQDTPRKCKRRARDQSFMCNQAAELSRCLIKVQDSMAAHLNVIQSEKGEAA